MLVQGLGIESLGKSLLERFDAVAVALVAFVCLAHGLASTPVW